jgi:glycosyltransferase involved in cell wall biosynthesis
MRILHVITSLRTGGAEWLVIELAKRLYQAGDEVAVLLFDGTRTPLVEELDKDGIPVFALGKSAGAMRNPFLLPRLRRFLRNHPYDIVHTHNTPCQFLVALVPHQTMITTEHNTTNRRRNWLWFKPIDRWFYGRYDQIICVGEKTRKDLAFWLNRPALTKKMTVIANGIDLQRFREAIPSKGITREEGFHILMVAAFRPQKDHASLIRALSFLPKDYHLLLAGGSETDHDRKTFLACQSLVRELNFEDRVHFLGVRMDTPELMAASNVVVLSTFYEGFGLSALEAMAAAKPVVASDVPGLSDLVGGAGILVPPGEPAALARTIQDICENPDKAREIGRRCQERAQKYDINETARQYRQLYRKMH